MTASYLIVVSELPEVRDTLLLRLMGAGKTLMTAIAELDRLPPAAPERLLAMPIVLRLRLEVPADPTRRSRDEQEFFMSTQDILEVWTQNAENEGIRKGLAEAVLSLYENALRCSAGRDHGGRAAYARSGRPSWLVSHRERRLRCRDRRRAARRQRELTEIAAIVQRTRDLDVLRRWHRTVGLGSAAEIAAALRHDSAS